jgi:hypothetical protein
MEVMFAATSSSEGLVASDEGSSATTRSSEGEVAPVWWTVNC